MVYHRLWFNIDFSTARGRLNANVTSQSFIRDGVTTITSLTGCAGYGTV